MTHSEFLSYQTKTELQSPFKGELDVLYGGRSIYHNYHLQDSPTFKKGQGLPAPFLCYVADGKHINRGEPICGQKVKNK